MDPSEPIESIGCHVHYKRFNTSTSFSTAISLYTSAVFRRPPSVVMSSTRPVLPRNQLSAIEKIKMVGVLLPAPALITWALITSNFSAEGRAKSWKRAALDRVILRAFENMNRRQIRSFLGETRDAYDAYIKSQKSTVVIDELGEDARLLWVGPRNSDRVILYLHGGAFLWGMTASTPNYLAHLQGQLEKKGKPVGAAILNYTLVPDAYFPAQLTQAVLAVQHLLKSGVKPENIVLMGDSAGGNLVHQLISHVLHPVEGVPILSLGSPFAGAYMMSPWLALNDDPIVHTNEGHGDVLGSRSGLYWGTKVLQGASDSALPYLNPALSAPEDWLAGSSAVVKSVIISAGGAEVLRDSIIKYYKALEKQHSDATLFVEDYGAHNDILLKFLVGDKDLGELATVLVGWLDKSFPN